MPAQTFRVTARVTALDEAESRAFLARQRVGRIAFALGGSIDIKPLSYTYDRGWILGRTSVGAMLTTLAHHPGCAFAVDHAIGSFDWMSVVAKGNFQLLDPECGSPDVYARALASVRSLVPEAFSPSDPFPHRGVLFGIFVNKISGRRMRSLTCPCGPVADGDRAMRL
jgi:nitroimidazol reductase NimA-like FMN-containing flavoprotein (pyridoxamine 5'-phosphate oxidase superfamily)